MGADSRRKGARAENDVVNWLNRHGFPHAERRLSGGPDDRGDITGVPGLTIEVKNRKTFEPAAYVDQLEDEMRAAQTAMGLVVVKRRLRPDVGDWYALTPAKLAFELLYEGGWGK